MKITLSRYAGFCDGVKRAYEMATGLDMEKTRKPVFVLGSLVHNQDVVSEIEKKGIGKIDLKKLKSIGKNQIGSLIVSAHGVGPEIYALAEEKGAGIIDSTCPKVVKVQRLARVFSRRGDRLIILGDRDHKEVRGIWEWSEKKGEIVSDLNELAEKNFSPGETVSVLCQTTQDIDFIREAESVLKKKAPRLNFTNTVCLATHNRQSEIRRLAFENEAVAVIGSPDSANSNRLFEIASDVNPKTVFIERASQINPEFFEGINTVAVTAGASAPEKIISEVVEFLSEI